MVNINIQKKDLWLLSAIMFFLVGVTYVIAIGSGNYNVHGHDAGEVEGVGFESWVDVTAVATSGTEMASSDGFITAYGGGAGNPVSIRGYSPTATLRVQSGSSNFGLARSVTMPVKNGNTWRVTGASTVYWIPLG